VATSMASGGYSGSTATGGTMGVAVDDHTAASHTVPEKRRISKAERKRLKKQGTSHPPPTDNTTTTNLTLPIAGVTIQNPTTKQKTKKKTRIRFPFRRILHTQYQHRKYRRIQTRSTNRSLHATVLLQHRCQRLHDFCSTPRRGHARYSRG